MYNRYSLHIDDEFSPVPAFTGPQDHPGGAHPPHRPPHPGPPPHEPPHRPPHPGPPPPAPPMDCPPPMYPPGGSESSILGTLRSLLGNFRIPKFELDDLLLLAGAYLNLRESGDDDLILILAALFFFGLAG